MSSVAKKNRNLLRFKNKKKKSPKKEMNDQFVEKKSLEKLSHTYL
jgi:hypothetical protein